MNNVLEEEHLKEVNIERKDCRIIKQIEKTDENGNLLYTIIPNYKEHVDFLTPNEYKYYKFLIHVVSEIRQKHEISLDIFCQVALNRIIDVNNQRVGKDLWNDIRDRSIDFVLYNYTKNKIQCCIELNDRTHDVLEERKKRDKLIRSAFAFNLKFLEQHVQINYDLQETIDNILS